MGLELRDVLLNDHSLQITRSLGLGDGLEASQLLTRFGLGHNNHHL